jgi:hypothetical protein
MLNKLSFLQTETHSPIRCPLSIDNFDYTEPVQSHDPIITERTYTGEFLRYMNILKRVCEGVLSAKDEKELIKNGKILLPHDGKLHETALNKLISSFAKIIKPAKSQMGLKQLRLRVVSEDGMPYQYSKSDFSQYSKSNFSTEYYGYYDSYNTEIVLCPERISKAPAKLRKRNAQCNISSRELYVVVLVHALAHALMDPTKATEGSHTYQPLITTNNGFSEREVLMEESLANMITLQYFEKLGKPDVVRYGEVRELIEVQPLEYRFGLDQFDTLKPDWRDWRKAKDKTKFIKDRK